MQKKKIAKFYIPYGIVLQEGQIKTKQNAFSGSFQASKFVQTTHNKNREMHIALRLCMMSVDGNVSCFVREYLEKQLTISCLLINRGTTYVKLEDICCYQTKTLLEF